MIVLFAQCISLSHTRTAHHRLLERLHRRARLRRDVQELDEQSAAARLGLARGLRLGLPLRRRTRPDHHALRFAVVDQLFVQVAARLPAHPPLSREAHEGRSEADHPLLQRHAAAAVVIIIRL